MHRVYAYQIMSVENVLGKYAQRKAPALIHMHLQAWILGEDVVLAVLYKVYLVKRHSAVQLRA